MLNEKAAVKMNIDFEHIIGAIKPMHSVGQPPWEGISDKYLHYLKEANIPYSRLHDMGGAYGGSVYVDIPNIFRNFEADAEDADSYDFAFTDILISAMMKHDCEPIYRLGVTIENYHAVKAYRTAPPADYQKWATICEHVIRHYTEGWADGFHYPITYWEIWNEPDNGTAPEKNPMWSGTTEEFYELYNVTAKHLKACFGDKIKVGGFGSCGFYGIFENSPLMKRELGDYCLEFFTGFLEYIKEHNAPMDFFSWHSYDSVENTVAMAQYLEKTLDEYGYGEVENHLNEWNNANGRQNLGTSRASAGVAAMMCAMQDTKTYMLCYYDARMRAGAYGGMFNANTTEPYCTYYPFVCFGEMYALGKQAACDWEQEGLYATAATDGARKAVMIANISGDAVTVQTNLEKDMRVYVIDAAHPYAWSPKQAEEFVIDKDQVVFIRNY